VKRNSGAGILDRRVLCRDGGRTGKLEYCGGLRIRTGEANRGSSAVRTFQIDRYPAVSAAGSFIVRCRLSVYRSLEFSGKS
jgi:hypothetical protein